MKKILGIITGIFTLVLIFVIGLYLMNLSSLNIKKAIDKTNNYLSANNLTTNLFANVLQMNLDDSYVYSVESDKYIIVYHDKAYEYTFNKLNKIDVNSIVIVDTIYDAINYDIDSYVYTKGYHKVDDGGASYVKVNESTYDSIDFTSYSNDDKSLEFINYESTINVYQMGYQEYDNLDKYVNEFSDNLNYTNIVIPKGKYYVLDNFDCSKSNKSFYSFDAQIICDDRYNPTGANNGCLFNIYGYIENIIVYGFDIEVKCNTFLEDPMIAFLTARDTTALIIDRCKFYLPKEASMYASSSLIDLFTGWKDVVITNCHLENHSSTVGGGGIGLRDILKHGCENAVIENNYIYSNCKDEVIAIFSGSDTSLYPDSTGGGYIKNVVFSNNTIIGGKPNEEIGPRVVGITVGYQISPVENVVFINNTIKMYSANYLLIYGKANDVVFSNNVCEIDASYQDKLYTIFWHNTHADPANNIICKDNEFTFISSSSLHTLALTEEEFSFISNTINATSIARVFDCHAKFESNVINVDEVSGCIYHNIKKTSDNVINIKNLNVTYEFYNLNLQTDILILSDEVNVTYTGANFMMFNGNSIYTNGYEVSFIDFKFNCQNVYSQYYYLAYDTSKLKDKLIINFKNSYLSIYDEEGHDFVCNDKDDKVTVKKE